MEELTFEQIQNEFKILMGKYFSNPNKEELTGIFLSASKLYLALTSIFLDDNNYQDKELKKLLIQLEKFNDNLYDEVTGKYVRIL